MSRILLYIYISFLLTIFSCKTKQENNAINISASPKNEKLTPPLVTIISNLPDSLQPKTIALNKVKESRPYSMDIGGKPHFTRFNTDNGLPLDGIFCSIMDKAGNLWFGTDGRGVSRYDGNSFTNYSTSQGLAANSVWSIAEDNAGNLWFGTHGGGVSRYDGNSFTTFSTAQGLANNIVLSIKEDKTGNLWFGTEGGGVSRYDPSALPGGQGQCFTTFTTAQGLPSNIITSIEEDKVGNLWFGTNGGGVSRYNPMALKGKNHPPFTTFTTTHGLANNNVLSITEDKAGNLWFGTHGGGVSRYDPSASQSSPIFTTLTTKNGLANDIVRSIVEDKSGNLWFGTEGGGVSRYDPSASIREDTPSFTTFSTLQGLESNIVKSIVADKTGNIWFATWGAGVSRYDGNAFTTFSREQGLQGNAIFSIAEDKSGNLWLGTAGGGVSRYDGNTITTYSTAQGLPNDNVLSMITDKAGNLWFGTFEGGVSRFDGKSFTNYTTVQGLANNFVTSIAADKAGNLWFATWGGGVSCFDGKSFTTYSTSQGLANNYVAKTVTDKAGNLWFGTWGGGVSRFDGNTFTTFSTVQGLVNNFVLCILEDKTGNLWFGTEGGGLSRLAGKHMISNKQNTDKSNGNNLNLFENFTTAEGLANDVVYDMVEDHHGNIFIGTNMGFTVIPAKVCSLPFSEVKPALEYYNSAIGYPVKDINSKAMYCDSKGIIWAGTGNAKTALVRFDYTALHKDNQPPVLVIKSIKVNEENICWHDLVPPLRPDRSPSRKLSERKEDSISLPNIMEEVTTFGRALTETERAAMRHQFESIQFDSITRFYPIPENLVLPYIHNQITMDYNAIEVGKPYLINYQYILEGYDKKWSPLTKKTSVTFGNIYEGTYTFKVRAKGRNGIWCTPLTYTFQVLPPLHRTWWAYLLYVLSFIGLIVIITRQFFLNRTRQLKQKAEQLKARIEVEAAHHETNRATLAALRAFISPHFLFNALNSIQASILNKAPAEASLALGKLADLMRRTLEYAQKETVPLGEALELLQLYLENQQLRFETAFEYTITTDDGVDMNEDFLPTMILQPFVENAIEHGFLLKEDGKAVVKIHIDKINGQLHCTIEDNGIGRVKVAEIATAKMNHKVSHGTRITEERLRLFSASNRVKITDLYDAQGKSCGTKVELWVG